MKLCVLILRGLDASHTGPYGSRWIDTPALNALASQSVVFETHLAVHPDEESTRHVWRTGRHRFPTREAIGECASSADLLDCLRAAEVPTTLLLDSSRPTTDAFSRGWGEVHSAEGLDAIIQAGRRRLAELKTRTKGMLWIEVASLLPPWEVDDSFIDPYFSEQPVEMEDEESDEPPVEVEPIAPLFDPPIGPVDADDDLLFEMVQTTFAAAISQLDSRLAELLDGLDDDIGLIVTSDHGQALAEHGMIGLVRPCLHREIVHVPLLIRAPGQFARRAPELTLSTDLAPTIADYFGVQFADAHGRSLLPLLPRRADSWRDYGCLGAKIGDEVEWVLWSADWTLRVPQAEGETPRLYVKPDDRGEVNDVSQHHPDEVDALTATLRAYVEASGRSGPLVAPPLTPVESVPEG